jgi:hypothetical protein
MSRTSVTVGKPTNIYLPNGSVATSTRLTFNFDGDGQVSTAPVEIPGTRVVVFPDPSGMAIASAPSSRRARQRRARRARRHVDVQADASDAGGARTDSDGKACSASADDALETDWITFRNGGPTDFCVVYPKPRSAWADAERVFLEARDTKARPWTVVSRMDYTLPVDCAGLCLRVADCNARIMRTETGALHILLDRVAHMCVDNGGVIVIDGTPGVCKSQPGLCALGFEVSVTGGPATVVSLDCCLTEAAVAPGGCAFGGATPSVAADAAILGCVAGVTAIGYDVSISGPITCQALTVYADDGRVNVPCPSVVGHATIIGTRSASVVMSATHFQYSCVARAWDKSTLCLGTISRLMLRGSARNESTIHVEDARADGETERYPLCIRSP